MALIRNFKKTNLNYNDVKNLIDSFYEHTQERLVVKIFQSKNDFGISFEVEGYETVYTIIKNGHWSVENDSMIFFYKYCSEKKEQLPYVIHLEKGINEHN